MFDFLRRLLFASGQTRSGPDTTEMRIPDQPTGLSVTFCEPDAFDDGWRPTRPANDSNWAALAWGPVRGISRQTANARRFAAHARSLDAAGGRICIEVEREPENPHDTNAIRVFGVIESRRLPLGYVPAETAARIAREYPPAMPLAARLSRIRDDARLIGIDIDVLRPSKRSAWWRQNVGT